MDGTGQLLRAQTIGLEMAFDVRCLAIPPDDLTSWDVLTARVVELVQAELRGVADRPVYLCGESFGGCLAIKVALRSPRLFDRIILVNPASSFKLRPWIAWGSQITRWMPEPLYQVSSTALMPLLANLERIAPAEQQAFWDTVQSVPQKTSIWRLSLLNQFEASAVQLRRLIQPVLIVASGSDRLLPSLPEAYRLASQLYDAQVIVLPYSGHACLLEADVNLYEMMKRHNFLNEPVKTVSSREGG
jgi:pimeloyl-ACP methyl ester carboxylesterase